MTENNTQIGALQAAPFLQSVTEQYASMAQMMVQAAQGATEQMRALMGLANIDDRDLRDLQQKVLAPLDGIWRTNIRAAQEMFRLGNPGEVIEWQQRYARAYLDVLTGGAATQGSREQHGLHAAE